MVYDRQKVACPTAVCCRLSPRDDCPQEVDPRWGDDLAVVGVPAAEAGAAAMEVVDGTTATPSCSMQIDSSTTDALDSARPNTPRPKRQ